MAQKKNVPGNLNWEMFKSLWLGYYCSGYYVFLFVFLACYMFANSFNFFNNHSGRRIMAIFQDDNAKIHQAQIMKEGLW